MRLENVSIRPKKQGKKKKKKKKMRKNKTASLPKFARLNLETVV